MPRWPKDRQDLVFVILILLHLLPVWVFTYFPSQDGPAHLENAVILREYRNPEMTAIREFYVLNDRPDPNWFGHLVLAALSFVLPILVVEKLLLSAYVILLPLSVRYALGSIHPDSRPLAVLAFPFIYTFPLHMGFYYFSLSLPVFFLSIGYWLKNRDRLGARRTAILGLFLLLLYFCHLVSLVLAGLVIGILAVWAAVAERGSPAAGEGRGSRGLVRSLAGRLSRPLAASVPVLVLTLVFFAEKGSKRSGLPPPLTVLQDLFMLRTLVSYDTLETVFSVAVVGLFLGIALYLAIAKPASRSALGRGLLMAVVVEIVLCFTVPDKMSGGSWITTRLALYPFLTSILWFGSVSFGRISLRTVTILAVVIVLGTLGFRTAKYATLNDYLEEYVSGMDRIEPNTVLLPLCYSQQGHTPEGEVLSERVRPFLHAGGYVAARRRVVQLANYEANTLYFPVAYRKDRNPYLYVGFLESEPPQVYSLKAAGYPDYVLIWHVREKHLKRRSIQRFFDELEREYDLIHTSPQRGLAKLYRRKGRE